MLREPVNEPEGHSNDGEATDESQQGTEPSEEESDAGRELSPVETGCALVPGRIPEGIDRDGEEQVEDQRDAEGHPEGGQALEHEGHLDGGGLRLGDGVCSGHNYSLFSLSREWLREHAHLSMRVSQLPPERDRVGSSRQFV